LLDYAVQNNQVLANNAAVDTAAEPATPSNKVLEFQGDEEEESEDSDGEEATSDKDAQEQVDEDFSYAWEVLDLTRVILLKQDTPEARDKLGETYLLLGDVSLETGTHHKQPYMCV
jgi:hypothetical protein